jgi:excinuclease ABC subunit C
MKSSDYKKLPDSPGVYLMKGKKGKLLYIGKAGNLRRRVSSYFLRPHDARISQMVSDIKTIDFLETDNALEALILEAKLIKDKKPPYNIKDKDDKSFLFIEITDEEFPRVLLVRGKSLSAGKRYGPFTSASSAREAIRILRKIFPWSTHPESKIGSYKKPCFEYEIGLCPGTCVGAISKKDYMKNIKGLKMFLSGQKNKLINSLKKDMALASKELRFEDASKLKKKIFSLEHIQDAALLGEADIVSTDDKTRIEGYDISNISGDSAVGSMVVFVGGSPKRDEYRKFKIRSILEPNDVGMMKEMVSRRLKNDWPLPDFMLVDGGIAQVNAVRSSVLEAGLKIPIIGMVKGPDRKKTDLVGDKVVNINKKILEKVRDEAHRFAISYHKSVRSKKMFS